MTEPTEKTGLSLHAQVFIALGAGVVAGAVMRWAGWQEGSAAETVSMLGSLFINLLKMVIVPLIFTSVVHAVAGMGDLRTMSRMGGRTFAYYLATTAVAVVIGLLAVNIVQPGVRADLGLREDVTRIQEQGPPGITDIVLSIVPSNPVAAMAQSKVLQIIFFALLFGAALGAMGARSVTARKVVEECNDAIILVVQWILKLIPYGVFFLMTRTVMRAGLDVLRPLAKYMATVVGGLTVHGLIVLPVLLVLLARMRPWQVLPRISEALVTAFSTSSSSATLPVTMDCVHHRLKVSERVTYFVLPIGATINMDGTALYEAVAAMFIAQAYGIDLSLGQQALVVLTATLASIGAAGIPQAGLFTMVIVLNAVGLPTEGIGLILAVDRILDMCRTTVNVAGDCVAACVIGRSMGETEEVEAA